MSDKDIFGTDTTPPVNTDPFADKLLQIKNENGEPKYKDVATALDALVASQQFIPTLLTEKQQIEAELAETKQRLQERDTMEDLFKKLETATSTPHKTPETNPSSTVVNEETLAKTVQSILDTREADRQREQNLKSVIDAVVKTYGDQAGAHIQKRATELGITTNQLRDMASNSPSVVVELLAIKSKPVVVPSQSSLIPPTQVPDGNEYPTYERGVARGGLSNKELASRWRESTKYTNKRLGLETS